MEPSTTPGSTATAQGDGFVLKGEKRFVLEGMSATHFIVPARTAGAPGDAAGLTLFLVAADAAGLGRTGLSLVDSRGYADLALDNVAVGADAVLGAVDGAFPVLDAILDRARAGLCAEMMGTAGQAFTMLVDYLKTRAPFWKKESGPEGEHWVESRCDDTERADRWRQGETQTEK